MKITSLLLQNTNLKAGRQVCCVPTDALNLLSTQDGARGATRPTSLRRLVGRFSLLALSGLLLAARAEAIVVTSTNDSGAGSLRQAIADAAAGDTITFTNSLAGQAIVLTSGELGINKNLTIEGLGARVLSVQRSTNANTPDFRIFKVSPGVTVNISGLTIANGRLSGTDPVYNWGGGILNEGTLTLDGVTVTANVGNVGGGVYNHRGTVTVKYSTISNNEAVYDGGGFHNNGDGATATLTLFNSTVSGNHALNLRGGAIFNSAEAGGGTAQLSLLNSTVSDNHAATSGGGIYNVDVEDRSTATVTLSGTIVANNNTAWNGPDIFQDGGSVSGNYSLVEEQAGFVFASGTNNIIGVDPVLGPLANNGGPTDTHALLAGSPAIDQGKNFSGLATDQRGASFSRTVDLDDTDFPNATNGDGTDIGAFEFVWGTPVVTITGPASGSVYAINTPVTFTGTFDNADGPHTAQWNIDGNLYLGTVNESAHTVSDTFTFAGPGVYSVQLTVTNACGNSATADSVADQPAMVVIYDPSAGFVTGGGWINSPAGAYSADLSLTGKASFAFVSKYKKGATTPTGETAFEFKVAELNFSSQSYEWLVVSGARAQYKGVGTINGASGFGFMLTLIDGQLTGGGGADKFRIKIWDILSSVIVYDNQVGAPDSATPTTVIGGGTIVIRK
jgi:hypothetical protein